MKSDNTKPKKSELKKKKKKKYSIRGTTLCRFWHPSTNVTLLFQVLNSFTTASYCYILCYHWTKKCSSAVVISASWLNMINGRIPISSHWPVYQHSFKFFSWWKIIWLLGGKKSVARLLDDNAWLTDCGSHNKEMLHIHCTLYHPASQSYKIAIKHLIIIRILQVLHDLHSILVWQSLSRRTGSIPWASGVM